MDPLSLFDKCQKSRETFGENAKVTLILPGRWGKRDTKRLCPGGPVGRIVGDNMNGPGVVVMFSAAEVASFIVGRALFASMDIPAETSA